METTISWTATRLLDGTIIPGYSFNPWEGCFKVSAGCTNCYADVLAKRYGHDVWGPAATTDRLMRKNEGYWKNPITWNTNAAASGIRRKVFCASMADVFEDHLQVDNAREKLWELIEKTPHLDWLLLTKRPENIMAMVPYLWSHDAFPEHVWVGTSVENQEWADKRIPLLLQVPARIRFLSCEPLIGPIDLNVAAWGEGYPRPPAVVQARQLTYPGFPTWKDGYTPLQAIDWVIVGGESGPDNKRRPFDPAWAQDIRRQCENANVPFYFKQHGGRRSFTGGDLLDGVQYHNWPD